MSTEFVPNEQIEFWSKNCWSKGHTPWQQVKPHKQLLEFHEKLIGSNKKSADTSVLVPLCGKSVDLIWLWQQGHTVVGIEAVITAIHEFNKENHLHLRESINQDGLTTFTTEDGKLTIIVGDFLNLNLFNSLKGKFDAVWDRGSLVAIEPKLYSAYEATIGQLINPHGFRYLLSTYIYECPQFHPPPWSIDVNIVRALYSDIGSVDQLFFGDADTFLRSGLLTEYGVQAHNALFLISK